MSQEIIAIVVGLLVAWVAGFFVQDRRYGTSAGYRVPLFAAVLVFAIPSVAYPQVPNAQDIAVCNVEAQRAVSAATVSGDSPQPNTKDHSRAAEAHRTNTTPQTTGGGVTSDDPQLAGMNVEGAKDPVYQAAYRTCMRKAGF